MFILISDAITTFFICVIKAYIEGQAMRAEMLAEPFLSTVQPSN